MSADHEPESRALISAIASCNSRKSSRRCTQVCGLLGIIRSYLSRYMLSDIASNGLTRYVYLSALNGNGGCISWVNPSCSCTHWTNCWNCDSVIWKILKPPTGCRKARLQHQLLVRRQSAARNKKGVVCKAQIVLTHICARFASVE